MCARDRVGAFVVLVPWRRSCRPRKRRDKEVSPRHGRRARDEPDFGTRAEFSGSDEAGGSSGGTAMAAEDAC